MSQNNQDKSVARKLAEYQLKKKAKKVIGKAAKAVAKKAAFAVKVLAQVLIKMLMALIGAIGLPTLQLTFIVIVVVILSSMIFTFLFSSGGDELTESEQDIQSYIVESANGSVNMDSDWERPYRVPETLIASVIQLDYMESESNDQILEVIDEMADKLKPVFQYGKYNEWKEVHVKVYEDGILIDDKGIKRTDNKVTKLEHVDYWNGWKTFTYTPYITDWQAKESITYREEKYTVTEIRTVTKEKTVEYWVWEEVPYKVEVKVPIYDTKIIYSPSGEPIPIIVVVGYETVTKIEYREELVKKNKIVEYEEEVEVEVEKTRKIEVKTITKTRYQRFNSSSQSMTDFTKLDNVLNSYGFGLEDKKLIEANYNFASNTEMGYVNWLNSKGLINGGGIIGWDGDIIPGSGVPPQYLPYYRAAEEKYGVHWYVLAAIHYVETTFSTHPTMISSAGAIGHVQFLPATWAGWTYSIGGGLVSPDVDITDPSIIAVGGGYGVDANGDGKADPWDVEDAIHSAANYLSANGYSTDPRSAIWHYNHAEWYIDKVLMNAENFRITAVYMPSEGDMPELSDGLFMRPAIGDITSHFGYRNMGTGTFLHAGVDIGQGGHSNVPIVAVADGVVKKTNTNCEPWGGYYGNSCGGEWGNYIMITHNINGQSYETVFAHLSQVSVIEGQTVKKGQMIGIMGNSGSSTGAHLHFELHKGYRDRSNVNVLNPVLYVPF